MPGQGGVPGNLGGFIGYAYFDNIMLTDGAGPTPAAVPEPGTWALMGLGFAGLLAAHRRRKS